MIDRHSDTAIAINKDAAFRPDEIADDNGWAGIGIGPVGQTRDSGTLDRSNFEVITEDLQTRFPDETEILRFGHWAVGWVEEIAYNVGNADLRAAVQRWRDRMDEYPIADDDHFSELEHAELTEYFTSEINRKDLPAGVTADAVFTEMIDNGNVSDADDLTEEGIDAAIAEITRRQVTADATPPTSQLQLVTEHGRPHCSSTAEIDAAIATAIDPDGDAA